MSDLLPVHLEEIDPISLEMSRVFYIKDSKRQEVGMFVAELTGLTQMYLHVRRGSDGKIISRIGNTRTGEHQITAFDDAWYPLRFAVANEFSWDLQKPKKEQ